jgi:proton glutamate symport protein
MDTPASLSLSKKNTYSLLKTLKSPWILLISMGLGILVGQLYQDFARGLIFPGELYLALFQMSVVPLVSTSIIVGLAQLLRSGSAQYYLGRMVVLFALTLLVGSGLGILIGFLLEPGYNLGKASEAFLGQALLENNTSSQSQESGINALLTQLIPSNVFYAYSSGKVLGIVFASIMIGAAMGMSRSTAGERFLEVVEGAKEVFNRILGWVVYGLPIGIFFMIAGQVSILGMDAVMALSKFVMAVYIACMILWVLYTLAIWMSTGISISRILLAISQPLFVSFSSGSSIAPIPMAQKALKNDLRQPSEVVDFVMPLAVTMNRHSYALLFALSAVFMAQLFGKALDPGQTLFILLTAALVGMATAGRLPIAAPMVAYILAPLGIPDSVAITIFITVSTILDPVIQSSILFGSCANTVLLGKRLERRPTPVPVAPS